MWKNQFITISSTISDGIPVAAWTVNSPPWKRPISQTTNSQLATPAPMAAAPPAATGRRYTRLPPRKLAVTAASTRIVSRPSRNTRIALLMTTLVWLRRCPAGSAVGSVVPPRACQLITTTTTAATSATAVHT